MVCGGGGGAIGDEYAILARTVVLQLMSHHPHFTSHSCSSLKLGNLVQMSHSSVTVTFRQTASSILMLPLGPGRKLDSDAKLCVCIWRKVAL